MEKERRNDRGLDPRYVAVADWAFPISEAYSALATVASLAPCPARQPAERAASMAAKTVNSLSSLIGSLGQGTVALSVNDARPFYIYYT